MARTLQSIARDAGALRDDREENDGARECTMLAVDGAQSSSGTSAAAPLGGSNAVSTQQFLRLLITQLQHQDPLNPLDDKDFTAQLAQFSSLEQLSGIRQSLVGIGALQEGLMNAQALNLLGRTVLVSGFDSVQVRNGSAEGLVVAVTDPTTHAQVVIKDAGGQTVRTLDVPSGVGQHDVPWDGKNDQGVAVADGTYHVELASTGGAAATPGATLLLALLVDGVAYDNAGARITAGGHDITFDRIRQIRTNTG